MSEIRPVDFHAHLDLYPEMEKAYEYCRLRRAITLAVTTTPRAFERNLEFAGGAPDIHVGLGVHPQLVDGADSEVRQFERLAERTRFVGEVGLDASREFYRTFDEQEWIFERIMNLCHEQGDKVISVHSVRSAGKVLSTLERTRVFERCRIVLHWFSASKSEIKRASSLGCMFSMNEAHVRSDAGKRLVSMVPPSSLLTETDGPFLLRDDEVVNPSDVGEAVRALSLLLEMSPGRTAKMIEQNARLALEPIGRRGHVFSHNVRLVDGLEQMH